MPGVRRVSSRSQNLFLRAVILSVFAGLLSLVGCKRTPPQEVSEPAPRPPFKIRSVGETRALPLAVKSEFADALRTGEDRRFVTVTLAFDPTVASLETSRMLLLSDKQQLFPCRGIGNADGHYCTMLALALKREDENFSGQCEMTGGGGFFSVDFKTDRPTAAFAVPSSIPLAALEFTYTLPPALGTLATQPGKKLSLPNGLTAEMTRVAEGILPGGEQKQIFFVFEVKNAAAKNARIHPGTIQLHLPRKPTGKGEPTWFWIAPSVGAIDVTNAGEREQRLAKPVTILAPGETRTLGLSFAVPRDVEAQRCELGFFREHVIPLAAAAGASSTTPKK